MNNEDYELYPELMIRVDVEFCPCCGSEEVSNTKMSKSSVLTAKYGCDTVVTLPDRAVIHLGRKCKSNMQALRN